MNAWASTVQMSCVSMPPLPQLEHSTEVEADVTSTVDNIISPLEDDLPCPAIHVSGTLKDGVYVLDGKSCNTESFWLWSEGDAFIQLSGSGLCWTVYEYFCSN